MQAPKKETKDLFLQYAALEEQYGLDRSAMAVYDQAARTVPVDQRLQIYNVYLAKAREMYGAKGIQKVSHISHSLQAFKPDLRVANHSALSLMRVIQYVATSYTGGFLSDPTVSG